MNINKQDFKNTKFQFGKNKLKLSFHSFKIIFNKISQEDDIKYDQIKMRKWYFDNYKKGNDLIITYNSGIDYKGFWGSIWKGIKGLGKTIASGTIGFLETIKGVFTGNFKYPITKNLMYASANEFKNASDEIKKFNQKLLKKLM